MRTAFTAALVVTWTLGAPAAASTPSGAPGAADAPAQRESAGWRVARLAVFGGQARVADAPATPAGCGLQTARSDAVASGACLACHGGHASHSHPVGIDYASASSSGRGSLRPLRDVVGRGVFLPGGALECTTCHDARSPWASHVALPPGAVAVAAVDARKPETYRRTRGWRTASAADAELLAPGSAVSAAPLCAACHTVAD